MKRIALSNSELSHAENADRRFHRSPHKTVAAQVCNTILLLQWKTSEHADNPFADEVAVSAANSTMQNSMLANSRVEQQCKPNSRPFARRKTEYRQPNQSSIQKHDYCEPKPYVE